MRCYSCFVSNASIGSDYHDLPGNQFPAGLQCILSGHLDPAAAGDFHPHDRDAADVVLPDDLGELLGIISFIQFGAADQGNAIFDEAVVKVAVGIGV